MHADYITLRVENLDKMLRYYQETFEAELIDTVENAVCILIEANRIELAIGKKEKAIVALQFEDTAYISRVCERLSLSVQDKLRITDIEGNTVLISCYDWVSNSTSFF